MLGNQIDQTSKKFASFMQFGQSYLDLAEVKFDIENPQEVIKEYNNAIWFFKQIIDLVDYKQQNSTNPTKESLAKAYFYKSRIYEQQQDLTNDKNCYLHAKSYCNLSSSLWENVMSNLTSTLTLSRLEIKEDYQLLLSYHEGSFTVLIKKKIVYILDLLLQGQKETKNLIKNFLRDVKEKVLSMTSSDSRKLYIIISHAEDNIKVKDTNLCCFFLYV